MISMWRHEPGSIAEGPRLPSELAPVGQSWAGTPLALSRPDANQLFRSTLFWSAERDSP